MHPLILEKPAHGCVIESIGLRSYMEDRKLIIEYNDGVILYAVMDGHGGTDVVDYVTKSVYFCNIIHKYWIETYGYF